MQLLIKGRRFGTSEVYRWNEALNDGVFELVAAGDIDTARHELRTSLGLDALTCAETEPAQAAT